MWCGCSLPTKDRWELCLNFRFDLSFVFLAQHDLVLAEQPMLLLSTLNGTLVAVSKSTGRVLWTLNEGKSGCHLHTMS